MGWLWELAWVCYYYYIQIILDEILVIADLPNTASS
jgi:hypothetical protein